MSHEKRSPIPLYGNLTPAPDGFLKLRKRSLLERIPYVKDLYQAHKIRRRQAQIRDLEEQLDRASYVSR